MSWWGSNSAPQPVVYPELPSPITKEDFERLADECFHQLMKMEKEGIADGWAPVDFQATNGEEEVKIWDKALGGSLVTCLKTQGVVPCSPQNLFKVMCEEDLAKRQEYEKECTCYEIVCEVTPEIAITRARYKAPFPVTAREVVAFRARRRLPGGGYVSFGKSINHDPCLTDSNHVRAALHLVGAICRPIPGEPNRCMLTRIAQLDPKGNIPTMVVNVTKKKSGASVILLRKVIRNRDFPPAEEEEVKTAENDAEEEGQEEEEEEAQATNVIEDDLEEEEDDDLEEQAAEEGEEAKEETEVEAINASPAHRPNVAHNQTAAAAQAKEGKGKEKRNSAKSGGGVVKMVSVQASGGNGEGDEELFYEAASSLPWDERPFRQMYGQHRDEVNQIVSSLQQSLDRLEQLSVSNEQRLQALERACAGLVNGNQKQVGPAGLVDFTNLSWGTLAFLAVWPVVAYSVYDLVSSRMRPPRK